MRGKEATRTITREMKFQSIPKTNRDEPYLDWTILQQVDEAHTKLNHGIVLQVYHTEPTPSQISPTIDDNDVNEDIASVYEYFDTRETIAPVTTNGILLISQNPHEMMDSTRSSIDTGNEAIARWDITMFEPDLSGEIFLQLNNHGACSISLS